MLQVAQFARCYKIGHHHAGKTGYAKPFQRGDTRRNAGLRGVEHLACPAKTAKLRSHHESLDLLDPAFPK